MKNKTIEMELNAFQHLAYFVHLRAVMELLPHSILIASGQIRMCMCKRGSRGVLLKEYSSFMKGKKKIQKCCKTLKRFFCDVVHSPKHKSICLTMRKMPLSLE